MLPETSVPIPLRAGVHAHDPGREFSNGLYEVGLGGHDLAYVLVGGGRLVEGSSEKCDPLLPEVLLPGGRVELLERPRPAHTPAGPVGGAVHRVLDAETQGDVARVGHRPGNDPQIASPGGGGALAVHDHLLPVPLFGEGEVVVVLGHERGISPDPTGDAIVDDRMIRRGKPARQAHREPVFLTLLSRELKPRQLLRLPFEAPSTLLGDLGVAGGYLVADAPAPRVGEEGQVGGPASSGASRRAFSASRSSGTVKAPNSTKWLPLPEVPSCTRAVSLRPPRKPVAPHAGSSRTSWEERPSWRTPGPKNVSSTRARLRSFLLWPSTWAESSKTLRRSLHAMSRPTAHGITASRTASTPPMGNP